jgi:hypothetical protein
MVRGSVDSEDDVVPNVGKTGLIAGWLILISIIWFVVGLACRLIGPAAGWNFDWSAGSVVFRGLVVAPVCCLLLGFILGAIGYNLQWFCGRRRGMATVHDLRPDGISVNDGTQELTCRLEILVPGMAPVRTDYSAYLGPLDATRFVEGASLACEFYDGLPERVRVWLFADPHAGQLTGRYVDFHSLSTPCVHCRGGCVGVDLTPER